MDTRCCKFCGIEFSKVNIFLNEGTFDEGFCSKFHRKDHEKQLMAEGKLVFDDDGGDFAVMKNFKFKDRNGEKIWFPKDDKPYFDKALRRTFHSIEEKHTYMKKHDIAMDGSSMPKRLPIEAGDMRNRSYRKAQRLED